MATSKSLLNFSTVAGVYTLSSYASDGGFVAAKGSAATGGDAYYNTASNTVRAYLNSTWMNLASDQVPLPSLLSNVSIAASVAANALTISLKTASGANASTDSPAYLAFRSATATTGTLTVRSVTSALSLVVPALTPLATISGATSTIFVYAIDNAGTVELAASVSGYFDEGSTLSTSAISGGNSATTLYSTAARTGVAIRLLGRITITEATAGTWSSSPTEVTTFPFVTPKQVVQGTPQTSSGTSSSATFAAPTNAPAVTITPARTGWFKFYGSFIWANSSASSANYMRLTFTANPPSFYSQETYGDQQSTLNMLPQSPYVTAFLLAGTSYTVTLHVKVSAGTISVRNDIPTNGQFIMAEEM